MSRKIGFVLAVVLAVALLSAGLAFAVPPSNGLIAYYPFIGDAGDESGNSHDGTVTGATLAADHFGNPNSAYYFDNSSCTQATPGLCQYVTIPTSPVFDIAGQPFTISAWINIKGPFLGSQQYGTVFDRGYRLDYSRELNIFRLLGDNASLEASAALSSDTWYHVAAVANGSSSAIYLNGVSIGSGNHQTTDFWGDANPRIGDCQVLGTAQFNGIIDEVLIYNRALTDTEVLAIYNEPPPLALTVTKTGSGTGSVTSNIGTITWNGSIDSAYYPADTVVTLTATPDASQRFTGWSGDCSGAATTCQVTMDAAKSVTAQFDRFIDLQNGTMYDTVSQLIWLKNANCFGWQNWYDAINLSNSLASGQCGLTDGSIAGDWHLPAIEELRIFTDAGYRTGTLNAAGFYNVQSFYYWSSTTHASYTGNAWIVGMWGGDVLNDGKPATFGIWPVRGGQSGSFGSLTLSPATAGFALTSTGTQSAPVEITLTNIGPADVSVSNMFFSGADSDQFTAATGTCSAFPLILAPSASCTVNVSFTPTSAGSKSADLRVGSNSLNPWPNVALSGTGIISHQTITVTTPAPASALYNSQFTVAATASSGLPVTYSSGSPAVCTNNGPVFTMTAAAGDCIVQYNQAGNSSYATAQQVTSVTHNIPPAVRFVDLKNGTMFDSLSRLIWLKFANCFGSRPWDNAIASANALADDQCGLTDGSITGDWHLPTVDELRIFTDDGYRADTLNTAGFSSVQSGSYWSSTSYVDYTPYAWYVNMNSGDVYIEDKTVNSPFWPVRSGQSGADGSLILAPSATGFATTAVGTSQPAPADFIISNMSRAVVSISAITITGADSDQFSVAVGGLLPCPSLTPTLAAGTGCTVNVTFSPTAAGLKTANLSVASDSPVTLSLDAALRATATPPDHYTVTVNPLTHGSLDPSTPSPATVSPGGTASFKFIADEGYYISSVTGCGMSYSPVAGEGLSVYPATTGAVNADCPIDAAFSSVGGNFSVRRSYGAGGPYEYDNVIMNAYTNPANNATLFSIELIAGGGTFWDAGGIVFDQDYTINLRGGLNNDFSINPGGISLIPDSLTITNGQCTVDGIGIIPGR